MDERRLKGSGHDGARNVFRILGPILIVAGGGLMLVALIDFFGAIHSFGPPKLFILGFLGMPILFVGLVLSSYGYMGTMARYQAGEMAPVAKDAFNYVAEGGAEGVKALAKAVGTGLAESRAGRTAAVRCAGCGTENDADARYCDKCGAGLARSCRHCGKSNDADAGFCDHCGRDLSSAVDGSD